MPAARLVHLSVVCFLLSLAAVACSGAADTISSTRAVDGTSGVAPLTPTPVSTPSGAVDPAVLPIELSMPSPLPSNLPIETIDVINLSSGEPTRYSGLSRSTTFAGTFAVTMLSPDQRKLARLSGTSEIEVLDLSTGNAHRFTLPGNAPSLGTKMSWAPDNLRLAVTTYSSIFVLNTSTGAVSQAASTTQASVGIGDLAWSPDGAWIVYADGFFLARVRPDGGEARVGPKYYGEPRRIEWSPISGSFAFDALELPGPVTRIFVSDRDLIVQPAASGGFHVSWDPSGRGFAVFYPANPGQSVMLADADGSNQRTLATLSTTGGSIAEPIPWSPDGRWIAAAAEGVVHVVSVAGGKDLTAVRPPSPVKLDHDMYTRCNVSALGWTSDTEIMTLMTCENSM